MMDKDFISIHTIVCPQCCIKQTGIIRMYKWVGPFAVVSNHMYKSFAAIKCCSKNCEHIITGDELEEVTRKVIQFPSDLNK